MVIALLCKLFDNIKPSIYTVCSLRKYDLLIVLVPLNFGLQFVDQIVCSVQYGRTLIKYLYIVTSLRKYDLQFHINYPIPISGSLQFVDYCVENRILYSKLCHHSFGMSL